MQPETDAQTTSADTKAQKSFQEEIDESNTSESDFEEDCGDFEEEEEEEDAEDEEEENNEDDLSDSNSKLKSSSRKKREPSLKLKQKLTNQDLELIVGCVREKRALAHIADVKKDTYVDKILRIELIQNPNNQSVLSNGRSEALLKKTMFPKDLTTLFDTLVLI